MNLEKVKTLQDKELLEQVKALSKKEAAVTVELLLHLAEVERRKLFLPLGYSSLFSYCREVLKYSEPAAQRRIASARCCARYPEVTCMLLDREVSLTTVSMVASLLTDENWTEVLEAIKGQSRREVEAVVSRYRPRQKPRETVKPVSFIVN